MHAAVDRNPGTADIATEFGREKYNQRRFLFRLAEPVQRNMESLADEIVDIVFADPQLIGKFLHRWRHDPARADGIYGNAIGAEIIRQGLVQNHHRRPRHVMQQMLDFDRRLFCRSRANIDQPAPALFFHMRNHRARQVHHAHGEIVEGRHVLGIGQRFESALAVRAAGAEMHVGDDNVRRAKGIARKLHRTLDLVRLGQIDGDTGGTTASSAQGGNCLVNAALSPPRYHDVTALLRELLRRSATNTLRATGNKGHAPANTKIHNYSPLKWVYRTNPDRAYQC